MTNPEQAAPVLDEVPMIDAITDYDRGHFTTYLRLLDADAAGANPLEVARVVLGLDATADPERAQRVHARHLERARWMTARGYRLLLAET